MRIARSPATTPLPAAAPDARSAAATTAPPTSERPAPLPPGPDVPGLLELARARPELAFPRNGHLGVASNAHYANTRAQLAWALKGDYNSLEGDVRLVDGVPVMAHDPGRVHELTFEQWAGVAAASGRMLRIDMKEARALPHVEAVLRRLGVPHDLITFNVSVDAPWTSSNMPVHAVRQLRERFDGCWITINTPVPMQLGYDLVARAARHIGGDRVGIALLAERVTAPLVAHLRRDLVVNVWNMPGAWSPVDVAAERARLRSLGVDGMIDVRRADDPLAND